eukprot:11430630-Alexandrium_andersonii.AAC.1
MSPIGCQSARCCSEVFWDEPKAAKVHNSPGHCWRGNNCRKLLLVSVQQFWASLGARRRF